ncbi:MAG: hypothetical protein IJK18_03625 [Clostridia bacterium]|nr:hypothetical protein [Clostridia bacterium]
MEAIYNNTFLNSLFTSDEFNFIKHLDSSNEEFAKLLENEKQIRDIIVNLINGLNDSIRKSNINHKNSSKEVNMLSKSQKVFETVNSNISMLQINEEISNNINKEIIDLLIKVEADESNSSESKFIDEIASLKTKIADFSNVVEDMKTTILQNDSILQSFINDSDVQDYFRRFSIKYSSIIQDVVKQEPVKTVEDVNIVSKDIQENNNCLLISETKGKVYLPYSKFEVLEYLDKYPHQYTSFEDVIKQEFINTTDYYLKHPAVSRFREAYALIRDREAKSIFEAFKVAMDMMFNYSLNPAIIAACKFQSQLENYLECLSSNHLDNFKDFEIKFEVAPLKVNHKTKI